MLGFILAELMVIFSRKYFSYIFFKELWFRFAIMLWKLKMVYIARRNVLYRRKPGYHYVNLCFVSFVQSNGHNGFITKEFVFSLSAELVSFSASISMLWYSIVGHFNYVDRRFFVYEETSSFSSYCNYCS